MPEPSFIDQVSDFFNGAFTDLSKFFSDEDEDYPAVTEMSEEDFHEFSKYWKILKFKKESRKKAFFFTKIKKSKDSESVPGFSLQSEVLLLLSQFI